MQQIFYHLTDLTEPFHQFPRSRPTSNRKSGDRGHAPALQTNPSLHRRLAGPYQPTPKGCGPLPPTATALPPPPASCRSSRSLSGESPTGLSPNWSEPDDDVAVFESVEFACFFVFFLGSRSSWCLTSLVGPCVPAPWTPPPHPDLRHPPYPPLQPLPHLRRMPHLHQCR